MLFGADGKPLNQSLSRFADTSMRPLDPTAGKPVVLEPGRSAPAKPEDSLTVNADTRAPSFASVLQAGEAYRPTLMESARMSPEVCCPKCGQICTGFTHTVPEFKIPDLPEELVRHLFVSATCGCSVTQEWAGAINAELTSRQGGGEPKQVTEMTEGQRKSLYARLEKRLFALLAEQDTHADKTTPAAQRVATLIATLTTVMQYISEPLRDLNIYKESREFVKQQHHLSVKVEPKDLDYNPNVPLPDLQKAALKAQKSGKQSAPPSAGAPSKQRLLEAMQILGGPDWLGTIAGSFPHATTEEDRRALKLSLTASIRAYARSDGPLIPEVHHFLYFIQYGRAVPLFATGGLDGEESINSAKAVPAKPVIRAVPGHGPGSPAPVPAPPPVNPADFHKQFERKKRRVRKVDRPPET